MRAYMRIERTYICLPKMEGISVAMMPLRSNVPDPGAKDWQLTTCPHCGRECWYQTENAETLKAFQPDIKFLCTECALTVAAGGVGE